MLLRHVSSRWLSLKVSLIRIVEQWTDLKHYFLIFLPKEKSFAHDIANTERYKYIRSVLCDKFSLVYIAFAISVAETLDFFLIKFQSSEPKIHLLYVEFGRLMYELMLNFVK